MFFSNHNFVLILQFLSHTMLLSNRDIFMMNPLTDKTHRNSIRVHDIMKLLEVKKLLKGHKKCIEGMKLTISNFFGHAN